MDNANTSPNNVPEEAQLPSSPSPQSPIPTSSQAPSPGVIQTNNPNPTESLPSMVQPMAYNSGVASSSKKKTLVILVSVILILAVIAAGVVLWLSSHKKSSSSPASSQSPVTTKQQVVPLTQNPQPTTVNSGTTYTGNHFTVQYPADWKLVPKDDVTGLITLQTPDSDKDAKLYIDQGDSTDSVTTAKAYWQNVYGDSLTKIDSQNENSLNGYDTYNVTASAPAYNIHDTFVVVAHNKSAVLFYYPSSDTHATDYQRIINSVKFSN
jgi:hypothetical protein